MNRRAAPAGDAPRWLVALAFACVAAAVTNRIFDPDVWQHLAVGRAMWSLHRIPHEHLWTWPSYGAPDSVPSWLFRALLWPWFAAGGTWGLQAWRWATTLGAFALLYAAARGRGATGAAPLVVVALCAMVYRQRSMARPETLVAVLFALLLWILESRRRARADRGALVPVILWTWVNAHLSHPIGFALAGIYALDEWIARRAARGPRAPGAAPRVPLWALGLAGLALGLVNPYGWSALWQPVRYVLLERREPIYALIAELKPVDWSVNLRNGLPLLVAGWPLLALWRWRRDGFDRVEGLVLAMVLWLGLSSQRFLAYFALAAVPFLGSHVARLIESRAARARSIRPRLAFLTAAACLGLTALELTRPLPRLGIGFDTRGYPVAACDFVEAHGIRGRAFNLFSEGGYLLWRFWPDRSRLPFIDIHQTGSKADRTLYAWALGDSAAWRMLDERHAFEWAVVRQMYAGPIRLDRFLGADSTWALVFYDDDAALYVRRGGALRAVADSFAYRAFGAGPERTVRMGEASQRDPAYRARLAAELARAARSSPRNGVAHSLLANIALSEGRFAAAREHLERARRADSGILRIDERLGLIRQAEARARDGPR